MIFAEIDPSIGWGSIISSVANIGFSALVAWYLLTKALPNMIDKFANSLVDQNKRHSEIEKEQRESFSSAESVRRTEHKDALQLVINHCDKESTQRDNVLKSEMDIINLTIRDNREVMEEVRDELRSLKKDNPEKI